MRVFVAIVLESSGFVISATSGFDSDRSSAAGNKVHAWTVNIVRCLSRVRDHDAIRDMCIDCHVRYIKDDKKSMNVHTLISKYRLHV